MNASDIFLLFTLFDGDKTFRLATQRFWSAYEKESKLANKEKREMSLDNIEEEWTFFLYQLEVSFNDIKRQIGD